MPDRGSVSAGEGARDRRWRDPRLWAVLVVGVIGGTLNVFGQIARPRSIVVPIGIGLLLLSITALFWVQRDRLRQQRREGDILSRLAGAMGVVVLLGQLVGWFRRR